MSRVFSWQQIRDGHLPTGNRPQIAKEMLQSEISPMIRQGIVSGARFVGSLSRGTATVQSDADVLVGLQSIDAYKLLIALGGMVEDKTYMPVNFVPIYPHYDSNIDQGMVQFFQADPVKGNVMGVDPVGLIMPTNRPPQETVLRYLRAQSHIAGGRLPDFTSSDFYKFVSHLLSTPMSLEKKVTSAFSMTELLKVGRGHDVELFTKLLQQFDSGIFTIYSELLARAKQYDLLLDQAINGHVGKGEYFHTVLTLMNESLPHVGLLLSLFEEKLPLFFDFEVRRMRNLETKEA